MFLRAHNNLFSGYIPSGVTRLKKLRELFLNTNELYSDLPPDIGDMEDLESLKVSDNEMFGPIPDSLYGLGKLKQLWLQDTVRCVEVEGGDDGDYNCEVDMDYGFEGSIRAEIGNLTKLEMLVLNNNPLTGTIPTEIGTCEDLGECRHCFAPWVYLSRLVVRTPTYPIDSPCPLPFEINSRAAHTQDVHRGTGTEGALPPPRQEAQQRDEQGRLLRRLPTEQQDR